MEASSAYRLQRASGNGLSESGHHLPIFLNKYWSAKAARSRTGRSTIEDGVDLHVDRHESLDRRNLLVTKYGTRCNHPERRISSSHLDWNSFCLFQTPPLPSCTTWYVQHEVQTALSYSD